MHWTETPQARRKTERQTNEYWNEAKFVNDKENGTDVNSETKDKLLRIYKNLYIQRHSIDLYVLLFLCFSFSPTPALHLPSLSERSVGYATYFHRLRFGEPGHERAMTANSTNKFLNMVQGRGGGGKVCQITFICCKKFVNYLETKGRIQVLVAYYSTLLSSCYSNCCHHIINPVEGSDLLLRFTKNL